MSRVGSLLNPGLSYAGIFAFDAFCGAPVETLRDVSLNDRQRLMINRLLQGFEGKLTSSKWAAMTKTSQDSALRDIQQLVDLGGLVCSTPPMFVTVTGCNGVLAKSARRAAGRAAGRPESTGPRQQHPRSAGEPSPWPLTGCQTASTRVVALGYAASRGCTSRSICLTDRLVATSRSKAACRLSQNCGVFPR